MVDRGFKLSYAFGTPKNFAVDKRYALVQHLHFIIYYDICVLQHKL